MTFVQALVNSVSGNQGTLDAQTRFLDAGLDSLMIVDMSNQIQAELGPQHEVPSTLVFDYPRLCDLSDFLVAALAPDQSPPEAGTAAPEPQIAADSGDLQRQIESMSEGQALKELLRELDE